MINRKEIDYLFVRSADTKERQELKTLPSKEISLVLKVLLIGSPRVGKHTLTTKYCDDFFGLSDNPVIDVNFSVKVIERENLKIKMQIWNIQVIEQFKTSITYYSEGADGVIYLFDVSNSNSLDNLYDIIEVIREVSGEIPIILVGNKADLEKKREISIEDGRNIAAFKDLTSYMEISASTGVNVPVLFDLLISNILKRKNLEKDRKLLTNVN